MRSHQLSFDLRHDFLGSGAEKGNSVTNDYECGVLSLRVVLNTCYTGSQFPFNKATPPDPIKRFLRIN
ncbi:hypothetical protein SBA5_170018 [Candidatus Sulfotelmatomonas gaucii]|uniref:Uncharacterized protein n=1 Tax=Candidatus Sulfuritelmatomonas gaucii TaxID=2043161 RepID=A0A2N9L6T3_9BACT|nr:hypothetical protein SBA5_170018 [Candidatus Sulfotelmatomonas gaucii]